MARMYLFRRYYATLNAFFFGKLSSRRCQYYQNVILKIKRKSLCNCTTHIINRMILIKRNSKIGLF